MQKQTETETKALSLSAEALAAHDAAGFTGRNYSGLSKPRNSGIAKAPNLSTSHATARDHSKLTPRMRATLTQLATGYGAAKFPLIGIDRKQLAIFINSGFIAATETHGTLSADCIARYGKPATAKPAKPAKPAK